MRVAAAVALAGLAAVCAVAPPAAADCGSGASGAWRAYAGPSGTVAPLRGLRHDLTGTAYVTDGVAVFRSPGGLCAWEPVRAPLAGAVRAFDLDGQTLAVAGDAVAAGAGVRFAVSDDGGTRWREPAGRGLPPLGRAVALAVAGAADAYLVAAPGPATAARVLYRTTDGGESWAPVAGLADAATATGVAADPGEPDDVWAWDDDRVWHSTDGGASFVPVRDVRGPVHGVRLRPRGAGRPAAAVVSAGGQLVTSADGGASWRILRAPVTVRAVTLAPDGGVGAAAGREVLLYPPDDPAGDAVRTPVPFGEVAVTGAAEAEQVTGLAGGVFYRAAVSALAGLPARAARRRVAPVHIGGGGGQRAALRPPALSPAARVVEVRAGGERTVPYVLDLGRRQRSVDVFFLVDTTSSLRPRIDDLRRQMAGIVTDLGSSGVDARFGVGAFREYKESVHGVQWQANYAYRLLLRTSAPGPGLTAALDGLDTDAGSDDGRTSAYAALYQAATGAGQRVSAVPVVPPGLDAGFRPGAEHVVVLLTDSEPRPAQPGYPGPALDDVATALARRSVQVVGLVAGPPPEGVPGPDAAMRALATRTGAVASARGADCDGDGRADVAPGQPLVCRAGRGVAGAIVGLVRGLGDTADVTLTATGHGGVGASVSPRVVRAVPVGRGGQVRFDASFTCPGRARRVRVALRAAHGATVTDAVATVVCAPARRPAAGPPAAATGATGAAVAAVAGAAVPPPPPPGHVEPITTVNVNNAANPNAQTGLAADDQTQGETQAATVEAGDEVDPAVTTVLAGMVMAAAAGAAALRTRHATASAPGR